MGKIIVASFFDSQGRSCDASHLCAVLVMRVVMAIVIDRVISASHLSCVLQLLM